MDFYQDAPELDNQFDDDTVLKDFLQHYLPTSLFIKIAPDLQRFGQRVVTDILKMSEEAESILPLHIPYDPWGRRIDQIKVSRAWGELDRVSAEEGIVAIGYKRQDGEYSRLYQFAKLYLFHPSSAIYSCPLAMTDGAARVLELHGDETLKSRALRHLTSTNPDEFWTSGQWMTERTGGSDVSGTSTVARLENGKWKLSGVKWFTSATTSQMAMALARIDGDDSGKLSLFYVELRNDKGELQSIRVNRLKDKLGTRALPTAELTLEGTPAILVGEKGKGVKTIATLFNITRVYNACCAVGYMRRGIALARSYAKKRVAFGKTLKDHALHVETLSQLQVRFEASFHLTFHAVSLLGKEETGKTSPTESASLRLLIPLAKLFTAKEGVSIASEVIESFGGAGYIEDTGLPVILRNAQVLAIWEGTTNVLSLDSLRAIRKDNAGEAIIADMLERIKDITLPELAETKILVEKSVNDLAQILRSLSRFDEENVNSSSRALSWSLASTYAAGLLMAQAQWESRQGRKSNRALMVARRWACDFMTKPQIYDQKHREASRDIMEF